MDDDTQAQRRRHRRSVPRRTPSRRPHRRLRTHRPRALPARPRPHRRPRLDRSRHPPPRSHPLPDLRVGPPRPDRHHPHHLDLAIPRGHRTPATTGAITWHHFDRGTFALGRTEITIPGTDHKIGLYSAERSIADAFRLRGALGYELGVNALKEWLRRGGKPAHLIELADQLPRARQPLLQALQVIA